MGKNLRQIKKCERPLKESSSKAWKGRDLLRDTAEEESVENGKIMEGMMERKEFRIAGRMR